MIRQLFTYIMIGLWVASPVFSSHDSIAENKPKDLLKKAAETVAKPAAAPLPIKQQFEEATQSLTFYFACKGKRDDISLNTQEESKLFQNLLFIMSDYHKYIQGTGTGVPVDEALNIATMERLAIEKQTKEDLALGCGYKAFEDMPGKIMRTVNYEPPKKKKTKTVIDEEGNEIEVEVEEEPTGPAIKPVIGERTAPQTGYPEYRQ